MPRYVEICVRLASVLIFCRIPAGCFSISTVFSHAQTVVMCSSCSSVLCQPTGGRARLTEGKHCASLGTHMIFNALRQGAHTVGRIEYSLPCIHPTCCLRRYFHSGYSFRLSPCNLLNQTSSHSDTHAKIEDARPVYMPPTK
jgi:ribosomal protein S27E